MTNRDEERREGPTLRIKAACAGCAHVRTERYRVQGDSGFDVYCDHPSDPGRQVGDTTWRTPDWCPLMSAALGQLIASVKLGRPTS